MPQLLYDNISNAAAARMIAVCRNVPKPDGSLPPANATNAELWAHTKAVIGVYIRNLIKDMERGNADPDLDTLG